MSRRAASFTEADVARICAGARRKGAKSVDVIVPGGVIYRINLDKAPESGEYGDNLPKEEESFTL